MTAAARIQQALDRLHAAMDALGTVVAFTLPEPDDAALEHAFLYARTSSPDPDEPGWTGRFLMETTEDDNVMPHAIAVAVATIPAQIIVLDKAIRLARAFEREGHELDDIYVDKLVDAILGGAA